MARRPHLLSLLALLATSTQAQEADPAPEPPPAEAPAPDPAPAAEEAPAAAQEAAPAEAPPPPRKKARSKPPPEDAGPPAEAKPAEKKTLKSIPMDLSHLPLDQQQRLREAEEEILKAEEKDPLPDKPSPLVILTEQQKVMRIATAFFALMVRGDAVGMTRFVALPFFLEDRKIGGGHDLFQEWLRTLRTKRVDLLTLYGVELLTPAEMEKKYGKPPARLDKVPLKGPRTYFAVANLSGHAAVATIRDQGGGDWRVIAYHD